MAGAPKGNKNAQKTKDWERELRAALHHYEGSEVAKGQALPTIAKNVVKMAIDGDKWAIEEIGNRLDGKHAQSVEHSGSIETRHVTELSGDQLASELARVRALIDGTASAEGSEPEPSGLH